MIHPFVVLFVTYYMGAIAVKPIVWMLGIRKSAEPKAVIVFAAMVAVIGAITITQAYSLLQPGGTEFTAPNAPNWSAVGFCFVGVGAVAMAGWQFLCMPVPGRGVGRSMAFGMRFWALLGGIYLVSASTLHWMFWADKQHAGVVNLDVITGVEDVPCRGMVPVTVTPDWVDYHCPRAEMYQPLSFQPFLPWPDYTAGRSVQLLHAMQELESGSRHFGPPAAGSP